MRLLEIAPDGEIRLTEDLEDNEPPPYTILSHNWSPDKEEVTFQDLREGSGTNKKNKLGVDLVQVAATVRVRVTI